LPCLRSIAGIISMVVLLLPAYEFSVISEHYHITIVVVITIFPFSPFLDMAG